jgi:serralysin
MTMKLPIDKIQSTGTKVSHWIMVTFFSMFAIGCSDDFESPTTPSGSTIAAIASGSGDFNILVASLAQTGLASTLDNNNSGEFTVFAPNDAAFLTFLQSAAAFNTTLTEEEAIAKIGTMTTTTPSSSWNLLAFASRLNYHIISSEIRSTQITGLQTFNTLSTPSTTSGQARLSFSIVGTDVLINANSASNGAKIIAVDTDASNGVIHTIDRVLTAPSTSSALSLFGITAINYATVPTTLTGGSATAGDATGTDYDILAYALSKTGLYTVLQPNKSPLPDFTIFAPTDDAMRAYLGDVAPVSSDLENAAMATIKSLSGSALANFTDLLTYHVITGRVLSSDLSNGQVVSSLLTGKTFTLNVNGSAFELADMDGDDLTFSTITSANVLTNASVVHRINRVMLPNP